MNLSFDLNGQAQSTDVEPRTLLADLLRDHFGLTGTHVGCDTSQCGCCTVLLDGVAIKSCSLLAVQAQGRAVTTIEGLADQHQAGLPPGPPTTHAPGHLHPVQAAFTECHALQCGFCTPGMVMATVSLLRDKPRPNDAEIAQGLAGNLCRCTGYINIAKAVRQAAQVMQAGAATDATAEAAR